MLWWNANGFGSVECGRQGIGMHQQQARFRCRQLMNEFFCRISRIRRTMMRSIEVRWWLGCKGCLPDDAPQSMYSPQRAWVVYGRVNEWESHGYSWTESRTDMV